MRNQRGGALVEYLMFIALVTGITVPILMNRFGAPLIQTFKNERSKFVAIIGQTPKGRRRPPVPAEWFSKTPLPDMKSEEINGGETLEDGAAIRTGQVSRGSQIQTGQVGAGSTIDGGSGIETGDLQTGGGVGGGQYSGVGTGGSGDTAGGDDFFSKPPAAPGGKMRGEGEEDGGGRSGRVGGGGSEGEGVSGREDSVGGGKKDQQEKSKSDGEGTRLGEGKKKAVSDAESELNERTKSKKFDWWLIVKILIVIFILALIFLLVIGNSRK